MIADDVYIALFAIQQRPDYVADLPGVKQSAAAEDIWWALVFRERGVPDPCPPVPARLQK